MKVNCGAISAGLVESELFGHAKGAFTGALANRDGRFTLADGGTIFLDEVGELPPDTQVKLLRVLQEQEFEPIGSSKTIKVDVRVIAATNRDLSLMVREGKFRSDLFYRLNVFPVTMPPLRERQEDVHLLVMFFLEKFARKLGKPITQVAGETMSRLCAYSWPGNIRELQNIIERAVVLSKGPVLTVEGTALFDSPRSDAPANNAFGTPVNHRRGRQSQAASHRSKKSSANTSSPCSGKRTGGSKASEERQNFSTFSLVRCGVGCRNWVSCGTRISGG